MTSTEAETIIHDILTGPRELERSTKFFDELHEEGFTVQDINPILRSHRMLGAPEWVPDKNAFRVRLHGACLEGRPTLLVVDLRPTMFIGDDYGAQSGEGAMSKLVCPQCGKPAASARNLTTYHYRESGLENVWLYGGVVETSCANCGNSSVRVRKEAQLLQVIARGLLMEPRPLAGPEWRFIRRSAGMSQAQLASAMKINRRATIADREGKQNPNLSFPEEVGSRLILLKSFITYLMTPGNNSLEPRQFEELVQFTGFFRDFAAKVRSVQPSRRITVAISHDRWALEEKRHAA